MKTVKISEFRYHIHLSNGKVLYSNDHDQVKKLKDNIRLQKIHTNLKNVCYDYVTGEISKELSEVMVINSHVVFIGEFEKVKESV